jgi:parvulin-like peptidyl-prolyl isomerase
MKSTCVIVVVAFAAACVTGCQASDWKWPWGQQRSVSIAPEPPGEVAAFDDGDSRPTAYEATTAAPARTTVRDDVVSSARLIVNGEEITVEDVLDPIRPQLEAAAANETAEAYREFAQQLVGARIWQLVNEVIVYRDAERAIDDRYDASINKEVDRLIQDRINRYFDGRDARFDAHLADLGITRERVRELTRRQVVVTQYLRMRFEEGIQAPGREELLEYYQAHLADFQTPASAELYLIEVPVSAHRDVEAGVGDATAEIAARRKARETAERAREEVLSGIDFCAVARQYSHDLKASEGGAWGKLTAPLRGKYALPSEKLFSLRSGEVSDVIEGDESFFIVKAGEAVPARVASFEEAQPEIRARLKSLRVEEAEQSYLVRLRDKASIERWDVFKREVVSRIPRPAATTPSPAARANS